MNSLSSRRRYDWLASILMVACVLMTAPHGFAFDGQIRATLSQGPTSWALLYTAHARWLRVENASTNAPHPVDLLDPNGSLTLLFPNNHSLVRVPTVIENANSSAPGQPAMPPPPSGLRLRPGPGSTAAGIPALPPHGLPVMPMPMLPPPMGKLELVAAGDITNLHGLSCSRYEIKQNGRKMEVWATRQLFPFQPYAQCQPEHFGPRGLDEEWPALLKIRGLFPILATMTDSQGRERMRFEVEAVTPASHAADNAALFRAPPDYQEIAALPF